MTKARTTRGTTHWFVDFVAISAFCLLCWSISSIHPTSGSNGWLHELRWYATPFIVSFVYLHFARKKRFPGVIVWGIVMNVLPLTLLTLVGMLLIGH